MRKTAMFMVCFAAASNLLPVLAQVDLKVHKQCIQAADYKGCVQVVGGKTRPESEVPETISRLKEAMRLLPDRLQNTNLQNFTANTQLFYDAVAVLTDADAKSDYEKELITEARSIKGMTEALQSYWFKRIYDGTYYGNYGYKSYRCNILKPALDAFNSWSGTSYYVHYNGTEQNVFLVGKTEKCYPQESEMLDSIRRRVSNALVDPEVKKAELAKKKRAEELAHMEPWLRHLEENPLLKKWAEANPKAAEIEKQKFLKKLDK